MAISFLNLRLQNWRRIASRIISFTGKLEIETDEALHHRAEKNRWELKSGVPWNRALVSVYSIAAEAIRRELGYRLYVEQIMGAIGLAHGQIIEMATGEGKTVTATLPVILRAMPGFGCHVVTSNDYLAQRDADLLRPVFQRLGLSTGCVHPELETDDRREQYQRDITYGTGTEMGFDFLRDRLQVGPSMENPRMENHRRRRKSFQFEQLVQRGHYFALVDEADNLLIDDARTPLIIGLEQEPSEAMTVLYRWCCDTSRYLVRGRDFGYEDGKRTAWLSETGARKVTLLQKPRILDSFSQEKILQQVEKSLVAEHGMCLKRDYVVVDEQVSIVCESTGRTVAGRKWQDGLHQAVEVKEQIPITAPSQTAATITVQNYFRMYRLLAGMTGTAAQARNEFAKYYKQGVTPIPTHRSCCRIRQIPRIFLDEATKRTAVVASVKQLIQKGRAVLIGTSSVSSSQRMSQQLMDENISHVVLNAIQHDREAEIVSEAGQPGRVTVATNMAGRGTDIKLHPAVAAAGGLHVIATEMNGSKRIDRQLVGRAARQGDPGSFQYFLSFEDELLMKYDPVLCAKWKGQASANSLGELPARWFRNFCYVQNKIERRDCKQRIRLFKQTRERMRQHQDVGFDLYLEVADGT